MQTYQTKLVREARRCGGGGWLVYDTAFRQQMATDLDCNWAKLNSSLYPVMFLAQANGRGKCYSHCIERDHTGDECGLSPRPRQERLQHPLGVGPPGHGRREEQGEPRSESQVSGKPSRSRGTRQGSARMEFNNGECCFPGSYRYFRICQKCSADDHPTCRAQCTPLGGGRLLCNAQLG